jgi:hypothetical protein
VAVGRSEWVTHNTVVDLEAKKVGIVIVDMWDKHWCASATTRVGMPQSRTRDKRRR